MFFFQSDSNALLWRGPKGDVLLTNSSSSNKYNSRSLGRVAHLNVDNCRLTDAGEYTCSQVSSNTEEVQFVGSILLNVSCKCL